MKRRPIVATAVAAAILLGLVLHWCRPLSSTGDAPAVDARSVATARTSPEAPLKSVEPAIASALEQLRQIAPPDLRSVVAAKTPVGGCQWPASSKRREVDLAAVFLFGFVTAEDLWRHPLLNPADVPICGEDEAALRAMLSAYTADIGQVVDAYRDVRTRERIELIESGRITPWNEGQATSDSEVAELATRLGVDREEARRRIARQPGGGRVPRGNYIKHDGRYYTSASFGVLPKSAAMYEHVKFIVGQRVSLVLAWFVANGFQTDAGALLPVLAEIEQATAP